MLKNLTHTLLDNKLYTAINVLGLAVAMTSCLVLGLFLYSEFTYDIHHERHENIYRIETEFVVDGRREPLANTSELLGPMMANDFPIIEEYVRFYSPTFWWELGNDRLIRHGEDAFYWDNIYYADDNVFSVFTHDVIYGNPETALVDPSSAVVSENFAARYFGDANPLGETITLDNGEQKIITLVFADLPANTHLKYDVLFSRNSMALPEDESERINGLFGASEYTYLLMPADFDPDSFEAMAESFFDRHMVERAGEINVTGWNAWLQPLSDIHLYSNVTNDEPRGNLNYLLGLQMAVAFILLIACINYVNLSTASAARRAHEIGMRKVLGGSRFGLALRFMAESVLFSMLALLLSLFMLEVVIPLTPVTTWLGQPDLLNAVYTPVVLSLMAGFTLLIGIFAGAYPALYLSSIPALQAVHHGDSFGRSGLRVREVLVFVQFAFSGCVLCCVFIMASQMRYLEESPLGFQEQELMMVTLRGVENLQQVSALENELESNPAIRGVSFGDTMLGLDLPVGFMDVETNEGLMSTIFSRVFPVGPDFIEVAGIELVEGRNFSREISTDVSEAIIVNEALVRQMGWDNPIGKRMSSRGRNVIGVVRDFNFESLHSPVEPLVLLQNASSNFANVPPDLRAFKQEQLILNIDTSNLSQVLAFVEDTVTRFDPEHPFDYQFIDQALNLRYQDEKHFTNLIATFASICVLIACLGLSGLATLITAQRTKEIGIRKVIGSSVWQIVILFTHSFSKLVLLSNLIAWPVAYFAMNQWLSNFAYRIDLTPMIFIGSGLIALCIAWVTVGGTAAKAASQKPVLALRYE